MGWSRAPPPASSSPTSCSTQTTSPPRPLFATDTPPKTRRTKRETPLRCCCCRSEDDDRLAWGWTSPPHSVVPRSLSPDCDPMAQFSFSDSQCNLQWQRRRRSREGRPPQRCRAFVRRQQRASLGINGWQGSIPVVGGLPSILPFPQIFPSIHFSSSFFTVHLKMAFPCNHFAFTTV